MSEATQDFEQDLRKHRKESQEQEEIINYDYYYNPNMECTCPAIFADTHRDYCKRRRRP